MDSPGLGESEKMDEILMNYLPNAFAYIYILDVARAGGVQRESTMKVLFYNKISTFQDWLKIHSQINVNWGSQIANV